MLKEKQSRVELSNINTAKVTYVPGKEDIGKLELWKYMSVDASKFCSEAKYMSGLTFQNLS